MARDALAASVSRPPPAVSRQLGLDKKRGFRQTPASTHSRQSVSVPVSGGTATKKCCSEWPEYVAHLDAQPRPPLATATTATPIEAAFVGKARSISRPSRRPNSRRTNGWSRRGSSGTPQVPLGTALTPLGCTLSDTRRASSRLTSRDERATDRSASRRARSSRWPMLSQRARSSSVRWRYS